MRGKGTGLGKGRYWGGFLTEIDLGEGGIKGGRAQNIDKKEKDPLGVLLNRDMKESSAKR